MDFGIYRPKRLFDAPVVDRAVEVLFPRYVNTWVTSPKQRRRNERSASRERLTHFNLISLSRSWRYSSAVIGGHFGCSPGGTVPGSASIRKSERKWRK